jgi:hypothetical protein
MRTMLIVFACLEAMASGQAPPPSHVASMDAVHHPSSLPCRDLPGAATLVDRPDIHVVWVGEQHGTEEMPAFLTDLACIASTRKRPVIVALERTEDEQPDWDRFLASDGSASAVAALTKAPVWTLARDGRNSRAILAMAERLRHLKQNGQITGVRLIDRWTGTPNDPSGNHRDEEMAQAVSDIVRARPDALVLVYSGNIHAMKRRPAWLPANVQNPAASYLPPAEVLSVNLIGANGEAWNCQASGCGHHLFSGESGHARSVVLVGGSGNDHPSGASEGFDALGYTGVPTTASPPAVPEAGSEPPVETRPISAVIA